MSSDLPHDRFETSLGPWAERHTSLWSLDLEPLPIFHGLSVLSRALAESVVAQAQSERIDIRVERRVRSRENPELLGELGVGFVRVSAEHETARFIARHPERFEDHLRALFGTLQRRRYRELLFPAGDAPPRALVFDFDFPGEGAEQRYRFLLEHVRGSDADSAGSLRVTIEDPHGRRLALDSLPHVLVEDLEQRTFIAGSTRIAQTWREGLRREAERGRRAYAEKRGHASHLFQQLAKAGLDQPEEVQITWGDPMVRQLLASDSPELVHALKKVLLALEDRGVRQILADRQVVRVDTGGLSIYLDQTHRARVLNLSLGKLREQVDLDHFLDRMPTTASIARAAEDAPLAGVRVFLVHHITSEVLGLIAALRQLGCRDLVTVFVAYSGEAPGSYLGPLLDLPADEFCGLALTSVPSEDRVEGVYQLSSQYSPLPEHAELSEALRRGRPRFYEAMQGIAKQMFVKQVERARAAGDRCLVIEDGGYLAPALQRACLEGMSVQDFLKQERPDCADSRALRPLLEDTLLGSVEHTRNGFDRLRQVQEDHGELAFPAFSIAVSRLKLEVEAREVALSILNAIDNVLHGMGWILSRRRCLVLGSRGAIGSQLMLSLAHRLLAAETQLAGIDLAVADSSPVAIHEARSYAELDRELRLRTDLVIGVTGASVLTGQDMEEWLFEGEAERLLLASGSTKTEEFTGLSAWLEALLVQPEPRLRGEIAQISVRELRDPITGRIYGHRYLFDLEGPEGPRQRELAFLANLTPVNFMFYGVPTELIDEVLGQLLTSSLGLVRRSAQEALPRRLQAVDREIRDDGEPLHQAARPDGKPGGESA